MLVDEATSRDRVEAMSDPSAPRPVLLAVADISGYTRFMIANRGALAHAQAIIGELIETIVAEVQIPLKVAKLEGDAVFLFGLVDEDPAKWLAERDRVRDRLQAFFVAFTRKLGDISMSNACTCGACANVERLRLKLVVHAGECVVHTVVGFEELAGVDVIVVHRLLKNSVPSDEYALFTDAAWDMLGGPSLPVERSVEKYEDVGDFPVRVWIPGRTAVDRPALGARLGIAVPWAASFTARVAASVVRSPELAHLPKKAELPGGWVAVAYVLAAPLVWAYGTLANVIRQVRA
jgi:hypothetical protein